LLFVGPQNSYSADAFEPVVYDVYSVDQSFSLSYQGEPDSGEKKKCPCDENGNEPDPTLYDRVTYTGNVKGETELDTSSLSGSVKDKSVTVNYYSAWACPDDGIPDDSEMSITDSATKSFTVAKVTVNKTGSTPWIWNFNGAKPANYPTEVDVTASISPSGVDVDYYQWIKLNGPYTLTENSFLGFGKKESATFKSTGESDDSSVVRVD